MSSLTIFNIEFIQRKTTWVYMVGGYTLFEYQGGVLHDRPHGHGKLTNCLYDTHYEGEWSHGSLPSGTKWYTIGEYIAKLMGDKLPTGGKVILYEGEFDNRALSDAEIIKRANDITPDLSKVKTGSFNATIREISNSIGLIESGEGTRYDLGNRYIGQFTHGYFTSGIIYYANGNIDEGSFTNIVATSNVIYNSPLLHGQGKMIKRKEEHQGEFYRGMLIKGTVKKENEEIAVDYSSTVNSKIIEECIKQTQQLLS